MRADNFTPAAAERLPGPTWLRSRRAAALGAVGELPEPAEALEEWRYSRIDELDLGRYDPWDGSVSQDAGVPDVARKALDALGGIAGSVVTCNGSVVHAELDPELAGRGVVFGPAGEADHGVLGAAMSRPPDRFAAYNDALAAEPIVLRVPRGVVVERPVVFVSVLDAAASGRAVFPRLSVVAGEDSQVSVVEVATSDDDVDALVVPVTEVAVGAAARVRHSALQDLGSRVWQIGSLVADVGASATLDSGVAALGGDYARLRLDCTLSGRGATGNLASVYFGDGDQTIDLRTFQEHVAPDTTSNLLFKGAVADRSHAVYTGMIRIRPDARGSNAFQTNRNVKLSEEAWAESVPNLEIENNDVRCSHASTVGPVDPDQRFYLESRGVPSAAADRLIVAGFFDEVLEALPVPALAPSIRSRLTTLLDRQVGRAMAPAGTAS